LIRRLNHAVLFVSDAERSATFYTDVMGMRVVNEIPGAKFMRTEKSDNDHDLGLFTVGDLPAPVRAIGLYHLAWEVDTLDDLVAMRERLVAAGALTGESDHGPSRSLYGRDPDGIEFEVMWEVPESVKAEEDRFIGVRRLDLQADLARFGGDVSRNA
jgi:catechol-2,3-dioxygenase